MKWNPLSLIGIGIGAGIGHLAGSWSIGAGIAFAVSLLASLLPETKPKK